jgi:hypothetical protein
MLSSALVVSDNLQQLRPVSLSLLPAKGLLFINSEEPHGTRRKNSTQTCFSFVSFASFAVNIPS